ncbi:MAG: glutathione S-transferase N-terminal domain-containing protein [Solirubrobacterales bacterium]
MPRATLYTIPGSHPGISAALMLERKGVEYRRVDLLPVISKVVLRALGFPLVTVPALKLDGRKFQGSIEIARALDRYAPEAPPLLPTGPERASIEEAEALGESELQHPIRQILWWLLKRDRDAMRSYVEGSKIGLPIGLAIKTGGPLVAASVHFNEADDENGQAAIAVLPGLLDRLDEFVLSGVIGGEEPNAADFQIAPSVRLAMTVADLRPFIEDRPIGHATMRLVPDYPGHIPPGLPQAWLDTLRG